MANTGFQISDGKDLIDVFQEFISGSQATATGFQTALGTDLNTIFAPYVSGTPATATGYKISGGTDLNSVFAPPIIFTRSTSGFVGGVPQGICSANNGIGYYSILNGTTSYLYKTTNYGVTWTSITVPTNIVNSTCGGVTTNAANTALILFYNDSFNPNRLSGFTSKKSNDGGTTWTNLFPNLPLYGGTMARNSLNNPVILNRSGDINYYPFNFSDETTFNATVDWNAGDRAVALSGSCAMSDGPNFFVPVTTGLNVYRNNTQNVILVSEYITKVTIVTEDGEPSNQNFIGTCCNANNTVNLIVNRTQSAGGGRIYRTTTWNGTFTAVSGSPVELWRQIATSSDGNVVCAIADTKIYVSINKGLTWKNITYNTALVGGETFKFVTVSPNEKFISVATTTCRIFYCTL